jgi:hypothetical protein
MRTKALPDFANQFYKAFYLQGQFQVQGAPSAWLTLHRSRALICLATI